MPQWCTVFSWYFQLPCQHPYTSATHLHYDHRRHHIISRFCNVLNNTFVCASVKNISEGLLRLGGCLHIQSVPDPYLSLNIFTSLCGRKGNWYIIIPTRTFLGIIPLSLWQNWFETWWEELKELKPETLYKEWCKEVITNLPVHTVKKLGGGVKIRLHPFLISEPDRD